MRDREQLLISAAEEVARGLGASAATVFPTLARRSSTGHVRAVERAGVANKAPPDQELVPYVERLAERIAGFPEAAVRLAKRRINAAGLPAKEDVQVDAGFF